MDYSQCCSSPTVIHFKQTSQRERENTTLFSQYQVDPFSRVTEVPCEVSTFQRAQTPCICLEHPEPKHKYSLGEDGKFHSRYLRKQTVGQCLPRQSRFLRNQPLLPKAGSMKNKTYSVQNQNLPFSLAVTTTEYSHLCLLLTPSFPPYKSEAPSSI